MIVDDETLARGRLIRPPGRQHPEAECLQANDGRSALAIALSEEPDVVLLDIQMPGMNGVEVATELEQLEAPLPSPSAPPTTNMHYRHSSTRP